ncbi:Type I transmembrane sorting receptor [Pseudocyphellaria aurata]|nr:Type I transmembrane sorting receptor [Pseudocyphellaria aurata]
MQPWIMFFSKLLNVAAIYSIFAECLSIPQQNYKNTFAVRRSTPRSSLISGPVPVLSSHGKFRKSLPDNASTTAATSTGTIVLSPTDDDHDYLTPIAIGGQTFNVLFDTGSEFLWVFSSEIGTSNHEEYDPSKSTTSKAAGSKWEVCYDGGRCVIGDLYTDTVSVGGITVDGQAVGAATQLNSVDFLNDGFDGVFGLSLHQKTFGKVPETTFLDHIEAKLPAPLFTVDLKKGKPGSCDFGFVDESKYTGDVIYVPVDDSQGDWAFDVTGYTVGTGSHHATSVRVIADTGTAFVFVPQSIVDDYYAAIPGAFFDSEESLYALPCDSNAPSITFDIGAFKAVLPGSFIASARTDDNPSNCLGGIQTGRQSDFILGSLFLKSQFVVFKGGNDPSIGFAAKPL